MNPKEKVPTKKNPSIIIPEFVFTDGNEGVFFGYDRLGAPLGEQKPYYVWEMALYDDAGNWFVIDIDTRKKSLKKQVTFIREGETYRHPIIRFSTMGGFVNPQNAHLLPHVGCHECEDFCRSKEKIGQDLVQCTQCGKQSLKFLFEHPEWKNGVLTGKCFDCSAPVELAGAIDNTLECPSCESTIPESKFSWELYAELSIGKFLKGTCPNCSSELYPFIDLED